MKELFLALVAQLAKEVPELVWIDLYNRQFENLPDSQAAPLPAVLIEIAVDWSGVSKGVQNGSTLVVLHVGQDCYEDTNNQSPQQAEALSRLFDLPQRIYLALQGLTGDTFSGLERTRSEPDMDYTNLNVRRETFKTVISDNQAAQPTGKIKLTPGLKLGKNIIPDEPYPEPPVFPEGT